MTRFPSRAFHGTLTLCILLAAGACRSASERAGDSAITTTRGESAATVAGDSASRIAPGPKARALLATSGINWRTSYTEHARLHLPAGARVAELLPMFVDSVEAVRAELLRFLGEREQPGEPYMELFFVDSREQMRIITGTDIGGFSQPGELTAGFVATPNYPAPLRHELVLALAHGRWGTMKSPVWLAEGLAALAQGECQGKPVEALAAGYMQRGEIPQLWELSARFRELPDLSGFMAAASAVDFIRQKKGMSGVRDLWQGKGGSADNHPFGEGGAALEAEWRAGLSKRASATLDMKRVRSEGC